MGKRKSSSKPQGKKKREPLATTFQCLFCNHENSVIVKIDKKSSTGDLTCKVCGQSFQTGVNSLSAPIDVYSDWVDACDAVAQDAALSTSKSSGAAYGGRDASSRSKNGRGAGASAGDDFIEDDDVDAEADYADE